MPRYEWICETCAYGTITIETIANRDRPPKHDHLMKRLPGGTGLLYFEEGRARQDLGLGGPPITSPADRARRMRLQGVGDSGDVVPESVRKNPKSRAMQEHLSKDPRGRWV